MTYHVGQVLPYDPPRGLTGEELDAPKWYALVVPSGRESAAREMLGQHNVHAQYPIREVSYKQRGKKIVRKLPIITRVVYAQFKARPNWDVMRYRRLITGVYGWDETPIEIPYDAVKAVMGLPTVAEELEAARREMLRVRTGDKARICEGPLKDFVVDVNKVAHGRAWFETITGIKGDSVVAKLERIVR